MRNRKMNDLEKIENLKTIVINRRSRMENLKKMIPTASKKDFGWMHEEIAEHEKWLATTESKIRNFYS